MIVGAASLWLKASTAGRLDLLFVAAPVNRGCGRRMQGGRVQLERSVLAPRLLSETAVLPLNACRGRCIVCCLPLVMAGTQPC